LQGIKSRLFTIGTGGATVNALSMTGGTSGKANGISLDFTNTGSLAFSGTGPRNLTLGGVGAANNSADKTNIFNPLITDQAATTGKTSVVKADTGSWRLAANNTYTGSTTINNGILYVTSLQDGGVASNIGQSDSSAANLVFGTAGGTLIYQGATDVNTNRLFTLTGGQTATINNNATDTTKAMNFTNTGNIVVSGGGAAGLTFNGSSNGSNTVAGKLIGNINLNTVGGSKWTLSSVLDSNFTGTVASDTGFLTLSNASNSYTGATSAKGSVIAGANGAFSANSDVTVNQGTLDTTGYDNTVKSLTMTAGSSLSQVKVSEGHALNVTNALTINNNTKGNDIGITDTGTLGNFALIKVAAGTGSIVNNGGGTFISGNNNYRIVQTASEIDAQHKATLATAAISKTIIAGATADIGLTASNGTPTGSDSLDYSVAAPTAVGTFTRLGSSPTNASGTLAGAAGNGGSTVTASSSTYGVQSATFVVTPTATGLNQLTSTVAKTVTANLNVKDHATASFDSATNTRSATLDLGTYDPNAHTWSGGTGSANYSVFNLIGSQLAANTAGLDLVSITAGGGSANFATSFGGLSSFTNLAAFVAATPTSESGLATFNPVGLAGGNYSQVYTLTFADHVDAGSTPQTMTLLVDGAVTIPEPSTVCMLLGVAGMGFMAKRRRHPAQA